MDWHNRITVNPNILVGKPIIVGTRIAVEFVMDLLGRGWTTEQILHEYDHLTPEDIQACMAYAGDILKSESVYLLPPEKPADAIPRRRKRSRQRDPGIAAPRARRSVR